MISSLAVELLLHILGSSFVNAQIAQTFLNMRVRPDAFAELFRGPTATPEQCMYQCVTSTACQAWYYPDPESICVTYRGNDSSGTPIPTGATSMQISGEYLNLSA